MSGYLTIARKEMLDNARDTRSLLSSAMYCLMGPVVVLMVSVAQPGGSAGAASNIVLSMMSVFALVATFVGGMNVAMDTVAGERERRSLLPLFLNPIPRGDVLVGKWLAASLFGLGGLALNLAGFGCVLAFAKTALPSAAGPLLWVVAGLTPLAFFATAMELLVSTLCRSTKEAHTYLSLLVFAPMGIGMFLVFFPHPVSSAFLVPIAGQQMMFALVMKGQIVPVATAVLLFISTISGAALALLFTAKLLERDEIVYGS